MEGELLVRWAGPEGPRHGFFSGYLKNPEATDEAWRGGWFHTGDVVRQDADGMLVFVDRKKNIIRRSGENIAAAEVEAMLQAHDAVAQVAVLAVPDEIREEEVMACVVAMAGVTADRALAEALLDWCSSAWPTSRRRAGCSSWSHYRRRERRRCRRPRSFREARTPGSGPAPSICATASDEADGADGAGRTPAPFARQPRSACLDQEVGAAVLGPALVGVLRAGRPLLAVADHGDPRGRHAARHQIVLRGPGPAVTERGVVVAGATLVGVALDHEELVGVLLEPSSVGVQQRCVRLPDVGLVELEVDVGEIGSRPEAVQRGPRGAGAARPASVTRHPAAVLRPGRRRNPQGDRAVGRRRRSLRHGRLLGAPDQGEREDHTRNGHELRHRCAFLMTCIRAVVRTATVWLEEPGNRIEGGVTPRRARRRRGINCYSGSGQAGLHGISRSPERALTS